MGLTWVDPHAKRNPNKVSNPEVLRVFGVTSARFHQLLSPGPVDSTQLP